MKHFNYPSTELPWRFDWPWQSAGNWFFLNWTFYSKNRFTVGFRILGFTKIYWVWTIKEEEARKQYSENLQKTVSMLEQFLTSAEK